MYDDSDPALQVDILAAALKSDQKESASVIEVLAKKFQAILPDQTTVVRGGWLLSSEKPVKELKVEFEEFHYLLNREKHGTVTARELKVVRGVALKSREVSVDDWITLVADALSKYASKNASARQALSAFILGG